MAINFNLVRKIRGYKTSKDYKKLFELAQKQSIVCICNYSKNCRDVAHTLAERDNTLSVSARGTSYITGFGLDDFVEQCEKYELEWIIPNKEYKHHA